MLRQVEVALRIPLALQDRLLRHERVPVWIAWPAWKRPAIDFRNAVGQPVYVEVEPNIENVLVIRCHQIGRDRRCRRLITRLRSYALGEQDPRQLSLQLQR